MSANSASLLFTDAALRGARYSLPQLLREVQLERNTPAFAMEKLEQVEITKVFQKIVRAVPSNRENSEFLALVRATPHFDLHTELAATGNVHGSGTLAHLQAIIDTKILTKDEACRLWANSLGIAYVDILASAITEEAISKIPLPIARKIKAIGLYVIDGVLTVALGSPEDKRSRAPPRADHAGDGQRRFRLPCEIEDAISIQYSTEKTLTDSLAGLERDNLFTNVDENGRLEAVVEAASLVRALDEVIFFALRERATDIHIEPMEINSRIRFRIDGMMREVMTFPRKLHRAMVARLKILCALNIAESRFPQDGRFSLPSAPARPTSASRACRPSSARKS